MTPTLSVEAVQDSVAAVWPTPLVARPVGVEGGVVSAGGGGGGGPGHAAVATFAVVVPEALPAASTAATPSV